ncbi:MAG: hypothetical protein ACKOB6_09195 [Candidatus Kapaibacterium sp.]
MNHSSNLVRLGPVANFFFAVVSLFPPCLTAQSGSAPALVPLSSVTGYTCVSGFSRTQSPALSAWDTAWRATALSSPSPFGLSDLQTHFASVCGPTMPAMGSAFAVEAFGGRLYREVNVSVGASVRVSPLASMGASLSCASVTIAAARSIVAYRCDAGASMQLSPRSRVSAALHNIGRSGILHHASTIPQDFVVGYGLRLDDDLAAEIQYSVVLQRSRSLQCSSTHRFASVLTLRIAADVATTVLGADVALDIGTSARIISSVHLHPVLGMRVGGGVSWTH